MGKYEKLIQVILMGRAVNNIKFKQICVLLNKLGFNERIKGSHHIFFMKDIEEILNLQAKGENAKNYQVKQVREIIVKYKLEIK